MSDDGEHVSKRATAAEALLVCAGCLGDATHAHAESDDAATLVMGCCGERACCEDEDGHEDGSLK